MFVASMIKQVYFVTINNVSYYKFLVKASKSSNYLMINYIIGTLYRKSYKSNKLKIFHNLLGGLKSCLW